MVQPMTAYGTTSVGIDPSLTATGVAMVWHQWEGREFQYATHAVLWSGTVRTKGHAIAERVGQLVTGLDKAWADMHVAADDRVPVVSIVVEDATEQYFYSRANRRFSTVAAIGAAVGAATAWAVTRSQVVTPPVTAWYPKAPRGHLLKKKAALAVLRERIEGLDKANEHVVMAAGLTRWWFHRVWSTGRSDDNGKP